MALLQFIFSIHVHHTSIVLRIYKRPAAMRWSGVIAVATLCTAFLLAGTAEGQEPGEPT